MHLILMTGCLALGAYAALCAWRQGHVLFIAAWFIGGVILHDLVGFPIYSFIDRRLQSRSAAREKRTRDVSWLNHVRVPLYMSCVLLLVAFPLIARLSAVKYAGYSGVSESSYFMHWALVTVFIFLLSSLAYAVRLWRKRRQV
jgi:hypothetical protein